MRILLTGAAGFIGGHLGVRLVECGHRVRAVDIVQPQVAMDGRPHVELADYRSLLPEIAEAAFDVVVHQAAITDTLVADSAQLRETNATGVGALARASAEGGARLVFASSASVYGAIAETQTVEVGDESDPRICSGPINAYAESKLEAEKYLLRTSELDFVAFRYTNVFGYGEASKGHMACILTQIIEQMLRRQEVRLFADTLLASRDFVPVSRVVDAVTGAAETRRAEVRGIYNLGAGVSLTFASILDWLCQQSVDGEVLLRLIPNPVIGRYQYRTAVSTTAAEDVFCLPPMAEHDVLEEASRLLVRMKEKGNFQL